MQSPARRTARHVSQRHDPGRSASPSAALDERPFGRRLVEKPHASPEERERLRGDYRERRHPGDRIADGLACWSGRAAPMLELATVLEADVPRGQAEEVFEQALAAGPEQRCPSGSHGFLAIA